LKESRDIEAACLPRAQRRLYADGRAVEMLFCLTQERYVQVSMSHDYVSLVQIVNIGKTARDGTVDENTFSPTAHLRTITIKNYQTALWEI
jgi:hypothetical protein